MNRRRTSAYNRNFFLQLLTFMASTLVFGVLGYFGILWLFRVFAINVAGAEDWNLLEGFVAVLSLSILAGGLVYPVFDRIRAEVVEAREKVKLSYVIYQAIFEKLTDAEQEAARRWILTNISIKKDEEPLTDWYVKTHAKVMERQGEPDGELPEGQRYVKMTLNCLDYIGFIAKHYWEIEDDSLDWLSPPIAKVWRRLGPYVIHIRNLRDARDYYVFAEFIGKECIQWRRDRGLPDEEFAVNTP